MRKVIMICDRCKKEYKGDQRAEKNRNLKLIDIEEDEYDICQDCQKELERWFDEGNVSDGNGAT